MSVIERDPLRRIKPGVYENERWTVVREAEDDGSSDFGDGTVIHPLTGREYVPAPEFSWFVHDKVTGDFRDAYPTLREARKFAEYHPHGGQ